MNKKSIDRLNFFKESSAFGGVINFFVSLVVIFSLSPEVQAQQAVNQEKEYVCYSGPLGAAASLYKTSLSKPIYEVSTGSWGIQTESYTKKVDLTEVDARLKGVLTCEMFRRTNQGSNEWNWVCTPVSQAQLKFLIEVALYPFDKDNCY